MSKSGPYQSGRRKRRRAVEVALVIALAVALSGCWSQFRRDPQHSGAVPDETRLTSANAFALTQAWAARPGAGASDASMAVYLSHAYAASKDGRLLAYDTQSGTPVWAAATGGEIRSSPAAGANLVWVGSTDGKVYAFSAGNGATVWTATTGGAVTSSPSVASDVLYVGSADHRVYSINSVNGVKNWSTATGGAVTSSPAVANGLVYVGSDDGKIYALRASTGAVAWSTPTGGAVSSSPAIANGVVFVGSADGNVYAFDASTGAVLWSTPTGGAVSSSPAVVSGVVFVGSSDGNLYALDAATGAKQWSTAAGGAVSSSPAVANGVVFVGSDDGALHAFAAIGGSLVWSAVVGGVPSSPAIVKGMVFVTAVGGQAQAYRLVFAGCAPPQTAITCENSLPGNPKSEWDITGAGDPSIEGFATDISVDHGQTVHFKVATPASAYHADIYRMGWYAGLGARKVTTVLPSVPLPQTQPACLSDAASNLHDCGNWAESASWAVPPNAPSGIYFARLVRDDGSPLANHVFFIVRDDESHSDVLVQTSDTTWQAYNNWGGSGAYGPVFATKSSYNRPFTTRAAYDGAAVKSWVFNAEFPMVRWLESNGYDVSYSTGVDTDRAPSRLLDHKVFASVGHDEYWSAGQRTAVEAARDAGVNIAFFSGNVAFWKIRWENSIDGTGAPYRTLVTYKESLFNTKSDPSPIWTGIWRDPRFSPPSDGGRPENAITGLLAGGGATTALSVTAEEGKLRLWRNTSVAQLAPGTSATLSARTVGYEEDFDIDSGVRPVGLMQLATTPLTPYAPSHVTLYRAPSKALVFDAGTVQWSWGLDWLHDDGFSVTDPNMQQATVNILADMGVQPHALRPGLILASPSSDGIAPTTTFTNSSAGATLPVGSAVTVSGAASDDGGGTVAAVEVSVDAGTHWHPATGRSQWTYTWVPSVLSGPLTLMSRAVDDSGNLGSPTTVPGPAIGARRCPCGIWNATATPVNADNDSTSPIEVGVKFQVDTNGFIKALRFYKSSANTGTHIAHLWTSTGTLLASATFTSETPSGWQQVTLPTPVPVSAGATYVASYHSDVGHVARDALYFDDWLSTNTRGLDIPPLHALWSRDPAGPNGVVKLGASGFPNEAGPSYLSLTNFNYWVDVTFDTSDGPLASSVEAPTGTDEDRSQNTLLTQLLRDQASR